MLIMSKKYLCHYEYEAAGKFVFRLHPAKKKLPLDIHNSFQVAFCLAERTLKVIHMQLTHLILMSSL